MLTSGSSTTNTYNYPGGNNLLSTVTQGATTVRSFSYDGAGNVNADDRAGTIYNFTYNKRARLSEVAVGATVKADYTYDGLERLAIRTTSNMTPSGTTHYVYDLGGHLIVESDSSGNTLREYVWLDDMPLAVVSDVNTMSPNLYFVHADHLDRPIKMTDGTEAVVWDAVYKPFGEVISITGAATNNLRFPGQYFLIEAGLHYNWYRHYDPTIGRYLQADPISAELLASVASSIAAMKKRGSARDHTLFQDGPSIYGYARQSPLVRKDFAGLITSVGAYTPIPLDSPSDAQMCAADNDNDKNVTLLCKLDSTGEVRGGPGEIPFTICTYVDSLNRVNAIIRHMGIRTCDPVIICR